MKPVSIAELESAINRARASQPATGHEAALSADVSRLADVYGELIFRGHRVFDADSLPPPVRDILQRWLDADRSRAA